MSPDIPNEHADDRPAEEVLSLGTVDLPLLPFAVQLQNIFPVDMVAKRYPMDDVADITSVVSTVHTQINLSGFEINRETSQAQICLEVHVNFQQEPRLFDIYFKLVGMFKYAQDCQPEMVQHFLQQGSLSVMLPSARELLLSLCTRLQVPIVVLPLIQLLPFSNPENSIQ